METVSEEEFHRLKEAVMSVALIGDNVYQKSTPEEVIRFMKFIEMVKPFDVVLDGLNVAFCITNPSPSNEEKADRVSVLTLRNRKLFVQTFDSFVSSWHWSYSISSTRGRLFSSSDGNI